MYQMKASKAHYKKVSVSKAHFKKMPVAKANSGGGSKKLASKPDLVVRKDRIRDTRQKSGTIIGKVISQAVAPAGLIAMIEKGLSVTELNELQVSLDLPMEKLAAQLGISTATLHRRKLQGKLGPMESDRVVRFARLMAKAVEVLESEENARQWLRSPQVGLGGAVPLDYAGTEVGAREVENLLGRIEYGVYA
jgi:putative toxin-antitoxin system antitoxin component (TIGR02293 family)